MIEVADSMRGLNALNQWAQSLHSLKVIVALSEIKFPRTLSVQYS